MRFIDLCEAYGSYVDDKYFDNHDYDDDTDVDIDKDTGDGADDDIYTHIIMWSRYPAGYPARHLARYPAAYPAGVGVKPQV